MLHDYGQYSASPYMVDDCTTTIQPDWTNQMTPVDFPSDNFNPEILYQQQCAQQPIYQRENLSSNDFDAMWKTEPISEPIYNDPSGYFYTPVPQERRPKRAKQRKTVKRPLSSDEGTLYDITYISLVTGQVIC